MRRLTRSAPRRPDGSLTGRLPDGLPTLPNLCRGLPNLCRPVTRSLDAPAYRRRHQALEVEMNKIHVTVVALILGVSGALGVAAATRTAGLRTTSAKPERLECGHRRAGPPARQGRARHRPRSPRQASGSAGRSSGAWLESEHRLRGSSTSDRLRSSSCGTTATTSPSSSRRAAMTSHVARLYSIALALFVFFLTWAAIGARPWAASGGPEGSTADGPRRARAAPPA